MAAAVATLVERPEVRRQMGRAARWEVEGGKFSLARMNAKLTRIYDEAVDTMEGPRGARRGTESLP